jgi:antitoxin component YwqK of YwqJK toxin-antitoxin module
MQFRLKCLRRIRCLPIIIAVALLAACTAEIDATKTYQRNGLVYEIGKDAPFSGVIIGASRGEDYRQRTVSYKKEYKNGMLHGRSYYYFPNGKIESVEPYETGILHGVVTRYYDNGQIKARIHFVDGYRGGPKGEMFWDKQGNKRNG